MQQKYEKLKTLLKELFQLDQPDLDFGLYRVMHAKSAEVSKFLDEDLLPQVRSAFDLYKTADSAEWGKALAELIRGIEAAGMNPEHSPKVKELRDRLQSESVDVGALESEVYDHLFRFFRRYYAEGDFLAKRVYKPGVYAIPYEGEEVKLHWASKDQYYIKTSEYLRDYAFRLRPEDEKKPMRVHFRLIDAAEGEHGNIKAAEDKNRVFVLAAPGDSGFDFVSAESGDQDGEVVIRFEYRPAKLADWSDGERAEKSKPPVQSDLIAFAVKYVLAVTDPLWAKWIAELAKPHVRSSAGRAEFSRLEAHVKRYVARNTFDYFIHKDLGPFLRRELDFFIKNEVMNLDDVESESAPRVEQYLSKIKVIRKIAGKIIDFLSQLEDFQKKLWLKKKFVVETQYCIAVGSVPEEFYAEIAANEAQLEEWVKLYAIDEIQGDLATPGYSEGLEPEFLKAHRTLVVDTRNFGSDFVARLLESLGDMDGQTDGVLVHGENFQALSLLQARYQEKVQCIYIDPPYNTDASAIDYKNGYKSSSWMSLLNDRLRLSKPLMVTDGILIAAIDDEQQRELSFIFSDVFENRLLGTICVRANPSGRPTQTGYSVSHEYLLFAGKGPQSFIGRMPPTDAQSARFSQQDEEGPFEWRNLRREGSNSDRTARPKLYYPIYIRKNSLRVPKMDWDDGNKQWLVQEQTAAGEIAVWPKNEEGAEKTWRWKWQTVMSRTGALAVRPDRSGHPYVYVKRRPNEEGLVSISSWFDAKYSATEHGTALLKTLFGQSTFSYPKSIHAVVDAIYVGGARSHSALVLDYFAGSGTTGHAVINLNRKEGGRRKFVLVEMGDFFDSVLVPRIKKVTFTPEWKEGRPERLVTSEEANRSPRIVKIIRLESFEDTLNNLEAQRSTKQQLLLDSAEAQGPGGFREQYILRYMLGVETRGSQSLLNVQAFSDPTAYKLKVKRPGSNESGEVNVDLVETFNWLIGLNVRHIAAPQSFSAAFERDSEKRLLLKSSLERSVDGPYWFRTVDGTTPDGRRTLVIWRKLHGEPEQDNLVLNEWFLKLGFSATRGRIDLIYVNGSNNLETIKSPDDLWKVRLIEEDFHRLMFDAEAT